MESPWVAKLVFLELFQQLALELEQDQGRNWLDLVIFFLS